MHHPCNHEFLPQIYIVQNFNKAQDLSLEFGSPLGCGNKSQYLQAV